MTGRRIAFRVILIVFIILAIWWICHVPHDPERIYAFIPPNAAVVFQSDNMAARYRQLLGMPLIHDACLAAGMKEEDYARLLNNRQLKDWLKRIAGDEVVVAYVPPAVFNPEPAILTAAWIGGRSAAIRWLLQIFPGPMGITRLPHGKMIWTAPLMVGTNEPSVFASFSIEEGVALGCLSRDPLGVRQMLDRLELNLPEHDRLLGGNLARAEKLWPAKTPERGWIALPPPAASRLPDLMAFTLRPQDSDLVLTLSVAGHVRGVAGDENAAAWLELVQLLGSAPVLAAAAPWTALQGIAAASGVDPAMINRLTTLLHTGPAPATEPAAIFLLGDAYGGHVKGPLKGMIPSFLSGIKIPVAVAALRLDQIAYDFSEQRLLSVLDYLNGAYGWALVPHPEPVGNSRITLIDEGRPKQFYSSFEPNERVACAVVGRWLVIATHAGRLKALLAAAANPAPGNSPRWCEDWSAPSTIAGGYLDGPGVSQLARNIIGTISLAMMFGDAQRTARIRGQLQIARQAADVLAIIPSVRWQAVRQSNPDITRLTLTVAGSQPKQVNK